MKTPHHTRNIRAGLGDRGSLAFAARTPRPRREGLTPATRTRARSSSAQARTQTNGKGARGTSVAGGGVLRARPEMQRAPRAHRLLLRAAASPKNLLGDSGLQTSKAGRALIRDGATLEAVPPLKAALSDPLRPAKRTEASNASWPAYEKPSGPPKVRTRRNPIRPTEARVQKQDRHDNRR